MMGRVRLGLGLLLVAGMTAGCSEGPTVETPTPSDAATPAAVDAIETTDDEAASPTTPAPTPEPVAFVQGLDDEIVVQTTPVSGGGARPVLAWEAFDGAADYVVAVHDGDERPYWAWTTSDTRVRIGLTERPETAPGPRVADGTTWVVIARDADGTAIASSPRRPIGP